MTESAISISIAAVVIALIVAVAAYNIRIQETAINNGLVQCVKSNNSDTYWTIPANCERKTIIINKDT